MACTENTKYSLENNILEIESLNRQRMRHVQLLQSRCASFAEDSSRFELHLVQELRKIALGKEPLFGYIISTRFIIR